MAIILNIDTATEIASICLSKDTELIQLFINKDQKEHASWLHPAVQKIIDTAGQKITDIEAVAVTIGPGSYTGLRVGLSAAKGLCYALNIPLIVINTLEMMAYATKDEDGQLFCPVIDARRNEVFTAVYDNNLHEKIKPCNMIINEKSFEELLVSHKMIFSGSGVQKLKSFICHSNAIFRNIAAIASDMVYLSAHYFQKQHFAELAYVEPLYLKEFYFSAR